MKIVYFAPIPFDYLKQRPQHIAELLAEKHEIYYIEPTVSLIKYVIKRGRKPTSCRYDVKKNLHVIRLNGVLSFPRFSEIYDILNMNSLSEYMQLRDIVRECDLIWVGEPTWFNIVKRFPGMPIVYDKMDDFDELTKNPLFRKLICKTEAELLEKADIALASCEVFLQRYKGKNIKSLLIRNGVLLDYLNEKHNFINHNKKKIFGYIGTISHWYDFHVLEVILNQNPNNEIVLVGDNEMPLFEHPRVHYVGRINKSDVPEAICHFDVCLYNFKQIPLLDTINPVKIYEYLAMNKPVLAVESRETIQFKDKLMLYKSDEELLMHINSDFKEPFLDDAEIKQFIYENSWEKRVEIIEETLDSLMREAVQQ